MLKFGAWGENPIQLHRFFAWNKVSINKKTPIYIDVDDCHLDENRMFGKINVSESSSHPEWMCDDGSVEFDIKINKEIAFNVGYGTSKILRNCHAFKMFWHAEGMKTLYDGWLIYNGEKYIIRPEDFYGYADKNRGKDFTSPWVWLSSNNLVSKITNKKLENSIFDIGGGRPRAFGITFNRILLADFNYEGESYEFNFSKFWTRTKTKFDCKETDTKVIWHVEQWNKKVKTITDVTCEKKDMLLINYEAPNGKKLHNRLWNGGNGIGVVKLYKKSKKTYELIDEIEAKNIGCEFGEYDKN